MQLNVDPGFDADLELAQGALERGWVTREAIENAILAHERTPGSRLLNHLPLTPDQLQRLVSPEGPMPPEIEKVAQEPARRLDHYILGDFLHSGGMGRVYKAWDLKLSRWVALKCLKAVGDERSEAYFDREARLAAGLSHPNIAAIYESGRAGGESFIAMQLIPGKTLDQWGRRDIPRLATWIRDAARAVAYANSRGIVHRDLKPTNLMVTPEGQVFVLDFGLARPVSLDASHSATGKAMGTPAYMSPEQARGGAVDARSDVYSLGATLFECLTGRAPFSGTTIYEVLRKVEEAATARPRRLNPRIPADLETIILKCLEKDAARRYKSADELADDLDRYLNHDPIQARPAGALYRARRMLGKRKAIALASLATVVLAGVLGWWFLVGKPHAEQLRVGAEHLRLRESAMKLWAEARGAAMSGADPRAVPPKARAAREAFERALVIREEPLARLMRGRCLQLESQDEEALKELEKAHELDPAHAEARIELAKALLTKYRMSRGFPSTLTSVLEKTSGVTNKTTELAPETADQRAIRERGEKLLAAGGAPPAQAGLLNGLVLMGRGKFDLAAKELGAYTRSESWDGVALSLEGICHLFAGDNQEAIAAFDRSLDRATNVRVLWWRGTAKNRGARYDAAIADFTKVVELDPAYASAFNSRGLSHAFKNQFDDAIADYTAAIKLDPDFAHAYNHRGIAKLSKRLPLEAIPDFTKASELNPGNAGPHCNLGSAKGLLRRFDEAIAHYTRSLELDPSIAGVWYLRGVNYSDKNMPDAAIADLTKAVELNPKHWMAWGLRGVERLKKGQVDEAIADYSAALEIQPSSPDLWYGRGSARGRKGLTVPAAEDLKKALEVAPPNWPDRAEAQNRLAFLEGGRLYKEAENLHASKRYAESVEAYRKLLEAYPRSRLGISAAYNMACGYALMGEKAKALESLRKAVDLGFKDAAHLEEDSDLDSLRDDDGFKKLLAGLKGE